MKLQQYIRQSLNRILDQLREDNRKILCQVKSNWRFCALYLLPFLFVGFETVLLVYSKYYANLLLSHTDAYQSFCWGHASFSIASAVGSVVSIFLVKRIPQTEVLFSFSLCQSLAVYLASLCSQKAILVLLYSIMGFSVGLIKTELYISYLCLQNYIDTKFLHILKVFFCAGQCIALMIVTIGEEAQEVLRQQIYLGCYKSDLALESQLSIGFAFFIIASSQILVAYYSHLYKKKDKALQEECNIEEEQSDTQSSLGNPGTKRPTHIRIIVLSTVMTFVVNALCTITPHYLLAISGKTQTHSLLPLYLFYGSASIGCIVFYALSSVSSAYTLIGVGLFGYGIASCSIVFDELIEFAAILCGMCLPSLGTNLMLHVQQLQGIKVYGVHAVSCGSIFGSVMYPLIVSQIFGTGGDRVFVAVNFIGMLSLVLFFVSIIDIQSQVESSSGNGGEVKTFIWSFLGGQMSGPRNRFRSRMQRLSKRLTQLRTGTLAPTALTRLRPTSLNSFRESFKLRTTYRRTLLRQETNPNLPVQSSSSKPDEDGKPHNEYVQILNSTEDV